MSTDNITYTSADEADGVTEVTLLGQNVNSYGRDLTLAARQAGEAVRVRPLFADLLAAHLDDWAVQHHPADRVTR